MINRPYCPSWISSRPWFVTKTLSPRTIVTEPYSLLKYGPEGEYTFPFWFTKNQKLLEEEWLTDADRVQILLKTLDPQEYAQLWGRTSFAAPERLKTYAELKETSNQPNHSSGVTMISPPPPGQKKLWISPIFVAMNFLSVTLLLTPSIILLFCSDSSYKNIRAIILKAIEDKPD